MTVESEWIKIKDISIPIGSIKSLSLERGKNRIKISIPIGSIKRAGPLEVTVAEGEFQFQ